MCRRSTSSSPLPSSREPIKELIDPEVAGSVWKRVVETADKYYQPGKFTTFAAYEWSSTPDNRNLHRNILFKDTKKVPALPFSSIDSDHPEDLWNWMDGQRKAGNEVLAISHNANLSDGVMFPLEVDSKGRPIDAAWAQSRVNNEPLSEIQQLKGASETHPALSPNDEFAGHEILEYLLGERRSRAQAARQLYPRRRTRTAWRCRTRAATTRTSSASSAPATRTTRRQPIPNRTILEVMACSTPRRRRDWAARRQRE